MFLKSFFRFHRYPSKTLLTSHVLLSFLVGRIMRFDGRDIVSIKDLSKEDITHILDVAEDMQQYVTGDQHSDILKGRIMSSLFFEPSTRTRLSFETAMHRLGGQVIGITDPTASSLKKGETLADTIRMADGYGDVIVLRHSQEGAARLAAEFADHPVLNAGDGAGRHPTQCLLDLFTIREEKNKIKGNNVVLVGDLKYGRTVHSLAYALALFGADLTFVSPKSLMMPQEVVKECENLGTKPRSTSVLEKAVKDADVMYVTRIQKERFPDPEEYKKVAGAYRVDKNLLSSVKDDLIIMHPLPRIHEITPEVDPTPHAVYFKQALNGVVVRMALLGLVLGEVK